MKKRTRCDVGKATIEGYITINSIDEKTGIWKPLFSKKNLIMDMWGWIVAKSMGHRDPNYGIATAYIEYYNVTNPTDPVTIPTYTRADQLSYYNSISSPGDFLRVSLSSLPSITVASGYETAFTGAQGNVQNYFFQTTGNTGILGRPFSNVNNSKVFGVALVSSPVPSDRTQDLIFARTYFNVGQQQLKVAGSAIGVTWSLPLL